MKLTLQKFLELNCKLFIVTNAVFLIAFPGLYMDFALVRVGGNLYFADVYFIYGHFLILSIAIDSIFRNRRLAFNFQEMLIMLFYAALIFGIIHGFSKYGVGAYGVARSTGLYCSFIPISYFAAYRSTEAGIRRTIKVLAILAASLSFVEYFHNLAIAHPEPSRAFGTVKSMFITLYLIDLLYSFFQGNKKNLTNYVSVVLLLGIVLISSQRAIWVALFVQIIIFMYINKARISFKNYVLIFVGIAFAILIYLSLPSDNPVKKNIEMRFSGIVEPSNDGSSTTRLIVWSSAINNFIQHPIIGKGIGDKTKLQFGSGESKFEYVMVHNLYLSIAEERGLMGLIPFLLLLILFLRGHIKRVRMKNFSLGSQFLAYIILISVYLFFWNDLPFLWIAIGVYFAIRKKEIENHQSDELSLVTEKMINEKA